MTLSPSGNTGYRCSTGASATIGSPLYMLLDVGFGEDPILRNGPDGPVYQSIDASNPWMGKPSFSMRVLDGAGKLNALSANMAVGDGQALAWGKRYYVVTRKEDDSCGSDRICFELRMSRLPAGVTSGDRFDWSPGSGNQAPAPVPLD